MCWFDAHEESATTGEIYLFGKIRLRTGKLASCCVTVRGIHREMYVLPKKAKEGEEPVPQEQQMLMIHKELEELRKKRFPTITKWMCKPV